MEMKLISLVIVSNIVIYSSCLRFYIFTLVAHDIRPTQKVTINTPGIQCLTSDKIPAIKVESLYKIA